MQVKFHFSIAYKKKISKLIEKKMSCYCSCNTHKQHLRDPFCIHEDYNLNRLKETNHELKSLIRKIDNLTDSISETRSSRIDCNCHNSIYECNVCRDTRLSKAKSKYEYVLCEDCECMLAHANEKKLIKIDHNVYPLEKYPYASQGFCSDCEKCRRDQRSRSRSRSQTRSRSAKSRSSSPYSRRNSMTELRPIWNGGKFLKIFKKVVI